MKTIKYTYTGKSSTFFTNGECYDVIEVESPEYITKDDKNEDHELSDGWLSDNFMVFTSEPAYTKTIKDAYEDLKGDLSRTERANGSRSDDRYLHIRHEDTVFGLKGEYVLYSEANANSCAKYICTVEEFNDYKPAKTALDAVIEFKGNSLVKGSYESHHTHVISIHKTEKIDTAHASDIGMNSIVCAIATYNTIVDELASNFGKCDISYQKHCENEVTRLEGESVYGFASGQDVFIAQINTLAGITSQRYYVKECWCACGHQVEYADLGLLFHTKEEAESKCRELIGLPPLEPPVKLIDGKAYQFDYNGKEYVGICNTTIKYKTVHVMFESPIKNTKINSEFCTNIKPLTVA